MDSSDKATALAAGSHKPSAARVEVLDDDGIIHHAGAVWESRDTYGPPGMRGLVASPFVFACAAFSALGGLLFGYDQGVVSVILVMPQFLSRIGRIADGESSAGLWKGLLTAMIELGALIGALNQSWIADKFSRKYSICLAVTIFTIGSAIQTGAVDYAMLTVARFIGGIGIGMLSMVCPLYISEIAPPEIRGALLVLEEFSIVTGIVIAYWITYGTRFMQGEWAWRLPLFLQLIPGFILGFGVLFLPFSPRWLMAKGRQREALDTLGRIRRLPTDDKRVRLEWFDIKAEAMIQREIAAERHPSIFEGPTTFFKAVKLELVSWADLFRKGCRSRTHVACLLQVFQQTSGINALIYYSPSLFKSMGQDYDMQLLLSGILNVTQLVGVTTSFWSMDKLGRKPLVVWGAAAMCIAHFIIAILVGMYSDDWPSHRPAGWVCVAFLFAYMLTFGATWGSVPWAYGAEVFPSSLRAKGVALSTASNWFANFIVGLVTPPLVDSPKHFGAYVFFAIWCLISLVWAIVYIRETKGRTLEQMDHVFGDNAGQEEAARRGRIERDIKGEAFVSGIDTKDA